MQTASCGAGWAPGLGGKVAALLNLGAQRRESLLCSPLCSLLCTYLFSLLCYLLRSLPRSRLFSLPRSCLFSLLCSLESAATFSESDVQQPTVTSGELIISSHKP